MAEEGFDAFPYHDTKGILTIGYGFNIDKEKGGPGLAKDECKAVLQIKLNKAKAELIRVLPWTANLDSVRFDVLHDMFYNMGEGKFLQFHRTLAMVEAGNYAGASQAMLESLWAKQVGNRALHLSKMMETGQDV